MAIAHVTSNETLSATATPPAASAGTIIIGLAFNDDPVASLPASGWNDLGSLQAATASSIRAGWKVHSGSEGSYVWTDATAVVYLVYSGVDTTTPIGDIDFLNTNTTTWTAPAKTIAAATSWVVAAVSAASVAGATGTPSGLTSRQVGDPAGSGEYQAFDTNGPVSSFSSVTGTLAASGRATGLTIELLAGITEIIGTLSKTEDADTVDATGVLSIEGDLSKTEDADTLDGVGVLSIDGTAALTEDDDTLDAVIEITPITSDVGVTEDDDTLDAIGVLFIDGTFEVTEEDDTLSSAASLSIEGTAALTEDDDTLDGELGLTALTATLERTEDDETLDATGTISIEGTLSVTEDDDTLYAFGSEDFTEPAGTGNAGNVQPTAILNKIIYAGV